MYQSKEMWHMRRAPIEKRKSLIIPIKMKMGSPQLR